MTELEQIKETYREQQNFLKFVMEEEKKAVIERANEELKKCKINLINDLKNEFIKLISKQKNHDEILRYLDFYPEKKEMYNELNRIKKTTNPKRPKPHKNYKFEEDHKEILKQLNKSGVSINDLFLWTEDTIFANNLFYSAGSIIRLKSNMNVTIQGKIICISENQIKIFVKGEEMIFSKEDFDNGFLKIQSF